MLFEGKFQNQEHPNDRMFSCFSYVSMKPTFPLHCHTHLEMVYVVRGSMRLHVEGKQNILPAGNIIFIPMMAPHSIEPHDDYDCAHVILQISPYCFNMGANDSSLIQRIKPGRASVQTSA